MISIDEVASAVLEETKLLGESMKFDSLDLTPEEQFARACEHNPLPEKETLEEIIEEVFWASTLTEDSRPCRPRLIYSPRGKDRGHWAHWLDKPVPLNRDSLRKLAPTQGPLGFLVWDRYSKTPEVIAIEGSQYGIVGDFTIEASGYGALEFGWHCLRIMALRAGRLDRRSKEFLPDTSNALNVVWKLLDSFEPVYLRHTIRSIAREGHGGAVWILRKGHTTNGIHIGYSVRTSNPPSRERSDQRFKWLESVGNMAAIDGAVLMNSQLEVLGIGCFLQVPNQPREVFCLTGTNKVERRESTSLGGGRHRSALEFCCQFAAAAAIVVSEDGRISIMWAAPNELPFWTPLSVLGFTGDLN